MTLPCERTSSGSVKLPVQAAPLWADAGLTPAEAASNPRATITKIRLRYDFMVQFLPKPDSRLTLYALPLEATRSIEHLKGRDGCDSLTIRVCRGRRLKTAEVTLNSNRPSEHRTFPHARDCYPDG